MKSVGLRIACGLICVAVLEVSSGQTAQHRLTVAANSTIAPTNDEVDSIIAQMNSIIATSSYVWDVPCSNLSFAREGDVVVNDNLLLSGTYQDLAQSLKTNVPTANVLVVTGINCSGIIAAGCGNVGSEPLIVGQYPGFDAQLWLHERGHNVGLLHSAEAPSVDTAVAQNVGFRFMFWRLGIGHIGKISSECSQFLTAHLASINLIPTAAAQAPAEVQASSAAATPPPNAGTAAQLRDAAAKLGLTTPAYKVVGPPWVEGMPVDEIKRLNAKDLNSIRKLLKGPPNQYWPQAMMAIALVGTRDDIILINGGLRLPMAAVAPGANPDAVAAFRNLLKIKLSAPTALGILANRTNSQSAVDVLKDATSLASAAQLVGEKAAPSLSKNALIGLSIANTPDAQKYLDAATASQPVVAPAGQPVTTMTVAPLTTEELNSLKSTSLKIKSQGIEGLLRERAGPSQ